MSIEYRHNGVGVIDVFGVDGNELLVETRSSYRPTRLSGAITITDPIHSFPGTSDL